MSHNWLGGNGRPQTAASSKATSPPIVRSCAPHDLSAPLGTGCMPPLTPVGADRECPELRRCALSDDFQDSSSSPSAKNVTAGVVRPFSQKHAGSPLGSPKTLAIPAVGSPLGSLRGMVKGGLDITNVESGSKQPCPPKTDRTPASSLKAAVSRSFRAMMQKTAAAMPWKENDVQP